MRLRDLDIIKEAKKPSRVCEYLDSIGIKFEKQKTENGAKFDLINSTPRKTKNLVDDILSVPEITEFYTDGTDNGGVSYAGGTTIVVEFGI